MEMSRTMNLEQLKEGIRIPDLLRNCYEDWIKKEDDITQEQIDSIMETMERFQNSEQIERMEVYEKISGI